MADEIRLEEAEPQFSIPDADRKAKSGKSATRGLVILSAALTFAVVAFLLYGKFKGQQAKPVEATKENVGTNSSSVRQTDGYQITSQQALSRTSNVVNTYEDTPDEYSLIEPNVAAVSSEFNVALMDQVVELLSETRQLNTSIESLRAEITQFRSEVDSRFDMALSKSVAVQNTLNNIGRDGNARTQAIEQVLSGIKGFQVDIQNQRQAFTFTVLHIETWGGRQRVVGFDKSQPGTIQTLYIGQSSGMWTLQSIDDKQVTFVHVDGIEHKEMVND